MSMAPRGYESFSTLNPQQQQLFSTLFQQLSGNLGSSQGLMNQGQNYLSDLLGGNTEAFEAPLMRQFQQQIIPQLAERFTQFGPGAQRSSAFQQALANSGTDLAERLGSLRSQLSLSALPQALQYSQQPFNLAQNLLGQNTQGLVQKPMGFGKQLGLGLAGGIGQGLGSLPGLKFNR